MVHFRPYCQCPSDCHGWLARCIFEQSRVTHCHTLALPVGPLVLPLVSRYTPSRGLELHRSAHGTRSSVFVLRPDRKSMLAGKHDWRHTCSLCYTQQESRGGSSMFRCLGTVSILFVTKFVEGNSPYRHTGAALSSTSQGKHMYPIRLTWSSANSPSLITGVLRNPILSSRPSLLQVSTLHITCPTLPP